MEYTILSERPTNPEMRKVISENHEVANCLDLSCASCNHNDGDDYLFFEEEAPQFLATDGVDSQEQTTTLPDNWADQIPV